MFTNYNIKKNFFPPFGAGMYIVIWKALLCLKCSTQIKWHFLPNILNDSTSSHLCLMAYKWNELFMTIEQVELKHDNVFVNPHEYQAWLKYIQYYMFVSVLSTECSSSRTRCTFYSIKLWLPIKKRVSVNV